jgi:hypothetical protein
MHVRTGCEARSFTVAAQVRTDVKPAGCEARSFSVAAHVRKDVRPAPLQSRLIEDGM